MRYRPSKYGRTFTCRTRYVIPKVNQSMDDFDLLIWARGEDDTDSIVEALVASHKFDSRSMALLKPFTFPSPPTPVAKWV